MRYYLTLWLFVLLVNTEVLVSLRSPQHRSDPYHAEGSDPHHAEGSDPLRDPVLSRGGGGGGGNATLHYGTPHGHRALFKGGSSSSSSSSLSSSSSSSLSSSLSASSASGASSLAGTQARREAPVAASNSTHSRMRRRRGRRKVMMMMVVGTPAERSKVGYGSEPAGNSSLRGSATPRHGRRKWPPVGGRRHNTASPPPPVPRRRWWGGGVGGRQQESDRRKRGTKDEHQQQHQHQHQKKKKKASERGRKRPNENERPAALRASPWEQMPKPAALSSSTDEPPSTSTRREDNPWDATPMTPPSPQDPSPHDLLPRNPFYPVTGETYGAYAIACVSAVIFLAGVAGNIAILCIVCQNYYMKSISNSLLANLAAWDFVLVFFCLPMVVFHQLTQSWLLGDFTCKVVPYLEVASLGVTTFTLCALCIDRFRAATNVQMYYEMIENCTSTTAKLAVIWIGALLLALPELLIRQLVVEEASAPDEPPSERCVVRISTELPDTLYVLGLTYEGARLWWCFGCYFCLPTLFTIGCSLVTARKIRRAERASSVRGNKKQIRLESQMNCTVVALAIVYGACVVPENICNIAAAYMAAGVPERAMAALHFLSQLLLFCRAAVTPALLLLLCRPLGRAFLDCCCCCCCAAHAPPSSAAGSDDNEHECTTELELSPFSTIRRELSNYTPPATAAAAAGTGGTNC